MWLVGLLSLLFGKTEHAMAHAIYIIVMIGGTIFHDRILIWIASTIIYLSYIKNN